MEAEQRRMLLAPDRDDDDNVERLLEELATNAAHDEDAARELKSRLWWRDAMINSVFIAMWFGFATILSMYNKWMFSPTYYNFPFPLFVTATHMLAQFALSSTIRSIWPHIFKPPGHPTIKEYAQKCVPCAVTTGLDIGLSNLSLKTITLSLYTMCKSSSLIFVLIFAFLFKLERFSLRLVSVILLIAGGVLLMVLSTDVEGHGGPPPTDSSLTHAIRALMTSTSAPLVVGIMLVFAASAFGGLRWALTQILLTGAHGPPTPVTSSRASSSSIEAHLERPHSMGLANPAATIFFLSPAMFVTLLIVSSYVEGPLPSKLAESGFFDSFAVGLKTFGFILFPGAIAFAMVMSEYYIIQRTGIVPMSIAGIFKEVTTILLATLFFHDDMTFVNWIGLFITVCGIATFTYHKYQKAVGDAAELEQEAPEGEIALPTCYETVSEDDDRDQAAGAARRRSSDDLQWSNPSMAWRRESLDSNESSPKPPQSTQVTTQNFLFDAQNNSDDEKHIASRSTNIDVVSSQPHARSYDQNVWSGPSASPSASKPKKDKDSSRRVRFSVAGMGDVLSTTGDNLLVGSSTSSPTTPSRPPFAGPT